MASDKRYCSFTVYPDAAPSNWVELLAQTGLPCCISPLHDHDVNLDGSPRAPHYHVLVCYSGSSAFTALKAIVVDLLSRPSPVAAYSVRDYIEYFTHKCSPPEDYHYSELDLTFLNGFSIEEVDYG